MDTSQADKSIFSTRRIAFVGVAKNTGKTTAMNYVLRRGFSEDRKLGVVSIGLDGEKADALLGTPKPPVKVFPGQVIITSEKSLAASTATFSAVESLTFDTPLGQTVSAVVEEGGDVVLSGVRHREDLKEALERLSDRDHVLIDGAYGRVMAAHAETCDGVLVSTGAVVGNAPNMIADKTASMVGRLTLPQATGWRAELMRDALNRDRTLIGGEDAKPYELASKSALVGLPKARRMWTRERTAVACLGVFSDRVAQELLRARKSGHAVVPDATFVQLDESRLKAFKKHWTLEVLHATEVVAISINPTSPQGHRVRLDVLAQMISKNHPNIPVFDAHSDLNST